VSVQRDGTKALKIYDGKDQVYPTPSLVAAARKAMAAHRLSKYPIIEFTDECGLCRPMSPAPKMDDPAPVYYVHNNGSIDMSRSIPALGIAYVTWSDGVSQIVTVAPVDGQGWCATKRRMIR